MNTISNTPTGSPVFGTDGVRGRANRYPITAEVVLRLGAAAGQYSRADNRFGNRVVIGKDTRLSGYMLENALTAGLTSAGMNVLLLGPVPTPAVGFLTHSMRADLGVMISASHNHATDNGVKFFAADGYKLSQRAQDEIERMFHAGVEPVCAEKIGQARRIDDGRGRYVEYVKTTFPQGYRLDGLKVVIDCANGAAYRVAPELLWELGAHVIEVGVAPNGHNINDRCGATSPQAAARAVAEHGADVALCLDGDADRVVIVDETGCAADGDQLIALFADRWARCARLKKATVVATPMSNLGLERFLNGRRIGLHRTSCVGDTHLVRAMRERGYNLGGEQSGHIVMTDYATTGDGLIAGLQFLAEMAATGTRASSLVGMFEPVPQRLVNVPCVHREQTLQDANVQKAIAQARADLNGQGRLVVRPSGTEPLIRIMVECEDTALLDDIMDRVEGAAAVAAAV